ncbi:hypothetical protein H311_00893 [Anncaliia algerae PRA109]|uniref:Large ribosomal subunit protein eL24-related N-terminal domain-containing protein n=2 Tax=Anncaliia algerae TaxID=723287 RepID=A0A059EVZ6_9MICR|nr:hypothetical protein H311_03126 [Anncaliia algerae PRA109]KCZ79050.1 hypothetical protein H312_03569 [Anncaliia algerae PRA339]CBH28905.1 similarity to 60S RIBOSOMAL PROTEIN L24 [Anncaliia algerae]KCZ76274.1 hypothetical protein H311_02732 [Anncaliia algerae PRA109]KCZ76641.1 hypothetical protein H311_02356 [Anncaliia algerae PRA109]
MLKEGTCIFSGHDVPKGSGLIKVTNDTRSFVFKNQKVLKLVERKINPKDIAWTQASRILHKKGEKKTEKKNVEIRIIKEVRGFPGVSSDLVLKAPTEKKSKHEKESFKPKEKVTKAESRKKY